MTRAGGPPGGDAEFAPAAHERIQCRSGRRTVLDCFAEAGPPAVSAASRWPPHQRGAGCGSGLATVRAARVTRRSSRVRRFQIGEWARWRCTGLGAVLARLVRDGQLERWLELRAGWGAPSPGARATWLRPSERMSGPCSGELVGRRRLPLVGCRVGADREADGIQAMYEAVEFDDDSTHPWTGTGSGRQRLLLERDRERQGVEQRWSAHGRRAAGGRGTGALGPAWLVTSRRQVRARPQRSAACGASDLGDPLGEWTWLTCIAPMTSTPEPATRIRVGLKSGLGTSVGARRVERQVGQPKRPEM